MTRLSASAKFRSYAENAHWIVGEVLYERHAGTAYSLAYRIVGARSSAEDVVQEAFLSIWRSGARYDRGRGSVRTWVLGIVHNRAIDFLRRATVHDRRRASDEGIEERFEDGELRVLAMFATPPDGRHSVSLDHAVRTGGESAVASLLDRTILVPRRGTGQVQLATPLYRELLLRDRNRLPALPDEPATAASADEPATVASADEPATPLPAEDASAPERSLAE